MSTTKSHEIDTAEALRTLFPEPVERVRRKQLKRLDVYCRRFIALSPFVCLATADSAGNTDVSPRGDAPGFVTVVDDTTLIVPDRRGNNRLDSLANILANPKVGLLFLVPGFDETLRVNGSAGITRDPAILAAAEVAGKASTVAVVVRVEEAFLHCGKAMLRSRLWDPEARVPRATLPGLGRMIAEQIAEAGISDQAAAQADADIAESYRDRLY